MTFTNPKVSARTSLPPPFTSADFFFQHFALSNTNSSDTHNFTTTVTGVTVPKALKVCLLPQSVPGADASSF